ncbi:hypothetical protein M107_2316 [Bacteroides fragilis str. 3725 D9(v)]|nr:hypothetical protein M073_4288 [Bacteroides fragilis str. DS-71]EXZ58733.1 hypothetical protein M116_1625 [Bacteroides fragilis str. 3719 A10]EXZ63124.1 hypothetical protein M107_2316 [Bacteroides fragilis str. 3725 D9(v)]EYA68692.1 hypothetical protein M132_4699 [Bacteroides fragilis str. S24L15]EYA76464.1 hypothetical protein M133_1420 [Bacteroides fragilis str. S24L26]EYA80844.1 hypothetical protein M134_1585 [Bacteroides fragilis str. S24L34]
MSWEQVLIIRPNFPYLRHVFAEERQETDSRLLARLNKGIINSRS